MLYNSETNTCETVQARMTALADSELLPAEAASMSLHISGCPTCTQAFQQTQQTLLTANAWKVEESDIWQRIESRIVSESKPVVSSRSQGTVRLPELLVSKRFLTAEQFAQVNFIHKRDGGDIGTIITRLGYATEREITEVKALAESVPFIDLTRHKPEPSAVNVVPAHVARRHNALPVKKDGTRLWVAMMDPRNVVALDEIRMVSRCQVAPLAAVPADLEQALAAAYPPELPTESVQTSPVDQDDIRAVLTEMRALRTEIQELRGEVGTLRRLLSAARQPAPVTPVRPLPPPSMMPLTLSENDTIGLL